MDCIFCKIVNKEIPANIVYEDDKVLAFLDHRPKAPGHTLIVHKTHTSGFLDTPDELLADLMPKIKQLAGKLMQDNGAAGFNLITNNGPEAGQDVFHLHFHIIPRK